MDELIFPAPVEEENEKVEYYEIVSGDTLGALWIMPTTGYSAV
jgi:hypothetical protein